MRHAPHGQFDYPHDDLWCNEFQPRLKPRRPVKPIPGEDDWHKVDRLARALLAHRPIQPAQGVPDAEP